MANTEIEEATRIPVEGHAGETFYPSTVSSAEASARRHGMLREPDGRPDWKQVLGSMLAVHVARAAEEVKERRADAALSGRKGGEVRAATMPRPGAHSPVSAPPLDGATLRTTGDQEGRTSVAPGTAAKGIWNVARAAFQEFGKDNGSLMAASVAFYLLLSLVPLIMVGISILGYVLGSNDQAQLKVMQFLGQWLPGAKGQQVIGDAVDGLIRTRGVVAGFGLVGLLSTALGGFCTLETAINVTWRTPQRNFIWNKVFGLGMMVVIGGLFLTSLALTTVVEWAGHIPALHWLAANWGLRALGLILPVAISSLTFACVYKWFPNTQTKWKPSLIAGVATGVLWEVFKIGYTFYSTKVDQSATYGTLGGLVGLVLWIFYSGSLVLLGSELAWVLTGCPENAPPKHPAKPTTS